MTELNPPDFLQNAGNTHTAEALRIVLGGLMGGVTAAGAYRSAGGVHPLFGGKMLVTQTGTASMSVDVAGGLNYIPGTQATIQGVYGAVNNGNKNVPITAANGTNPRNDIIVARVNDSQYAGALNNWVLEAVPGTPSASPVDPSLPANSISLARVRVNANASSIVTANITDLRKWATGLGGTMICSGVSDRPAAATCMPGQELFETSTGFAYRNNAAQTKWLRQANTKVKTGALSTPTNSTALVNDPELWFPLEAGSVYKWKLQYFFSALATPKINVAIRFPALGTNGRVDLQRHTNGSGLTPFLQLVANQTVTDLGNTGYPDGGSWGTMNLEGSIITGANMSAGNFQIAIGQFVADPNASFVLIGSSLDHVQVA